MMRRISILIALLGFALMFERMIAGYIEQQTLLPLARHYVAAVPVELGAPNVVTGILIAFRGFDTLGEVAVLFMVATSVGVLLAAHPGEKVETASNASRPASELVRSGASILLPLIFLFGAYVIINGHLSAGGGFQGGAVVASGIMLLMISNPQTRLYHTFLSVTESLAGVFYVLAGISGLVLAGGFLDSRILPTGDFGTLFSAGSIPMISALLGIKVSAELSVVIDRFRG